MSSQSFRFCKFVDNKSSYGEPNLRARSDGLCAALRAGLQAGTQHSIYTAIQQKTSGLQSGTGDLTRQIEIIAANEMLLILFITVARFWRVACVESDLPSDKARPRLEDWSSSMPTPSYLLNDKV